MPVSNASTCSSLIAQKTISHTKEELEEEANIDAVMSKSCVNHCVDVNAGKRIHGTFRRAGQCGHLGVRKLLLERLLERDTEVDVLNDEVLVNTLAVVLGKRY